MKYRETKCSCESDRHKKSENNTSAVFPRHQSVVTLFIYFSIPLFRVYFSRLQTPRLRLVSGSVQMTIYLSTMFPSSILVSINSYLRLLIYPSPLKIDIILSSGNHQAVHTLICLLSNLFRTSSYSLFLSLSSLLIMSSLISLWIPSVSLFYSLPSLKLFSFILVRPFSFLLSLSSPETHANKYINTNFNLSSVTFLLASFPKLNLKLFLCTKNNNYNLLQKWADLLAFNQNRTSKINDGVMFSVSLKV